MHMGGDHIWGGALSREVELGGKRAEETRAAELARLRGSAVSGGSLQWRSKRRVTSSEFT